MFYGAQKRIDLWCVSDAVKGNCVWYSVFIYRDGVTLDAIDAIWSGSLGLKFGILFCRDGVCN